jgi:prepilin-type N-terminal cleavage/methylation domain-containing protein
MKKKEGGFTLIEMIIVMAIVAIISVIFVGSSQDNRRGIALITERAKVVGVLQRAKSFALERKEGACAFGVHFQKPGTMIIFGDLSENEGRCEEGDFNKKYDSGEGIENISLDEHVKFLELPYSDLYPRGDSYDFVFIPPYLETERWGTIKISNELDETCVEVGSGGQIYSNEDCN